MLYKKITSLTLVFLLLFPISTCKKKSPTGPELESPVYPSQAVDVKGKTDSSGKVKLQVPDSNFIVEATVKNESNEPIPNIDVALLAEGSEFVVFASDPGGNYLPSMKEGSLQTQITSITGEVRIAVIPVAVVLILFAIQAYQAWEAGIAIGELIKDPPRLTKISPNYQEYCMTKKQFRNYLKAHFNIAGLFLFGTYQGIRAVFSVVSLLGSPAIEDFLPNLWFTAGVIEKKIGVFIIPGIGLPFYIDAGICKTGPVEPTVVDDFETSSLTASGWVIDKGLCDYGMCFPRIVYRGMDGWTPKLDAYHKKKYLQLYSGPKFPNRVEKMLLHKDVTVPSDAIVLKLHYVGLVDDLGYGYSRFYLKDKNGNIIRNSGWIKSSKSLVWKELRFNVNAFQGNKVSLHIELWDDGEPWSGAMTLVDYILFD